jgi:hypothetical protein
MENSVIWVSHCHTAALIWSLSLPYSDSIHLLSQGHTSLDNRDWIQCCLWFSMESHKHNSSTWELVNIGSQFKSTLGNCRKNDVTKNMKNVMDNVQVGEHWKWWTCVHSPALQTMLSVLSFLHRGDCEQLVERHKQSSLNDQSPDMNSAPTLGTFTLSFSFL